MIAVMGGLTRVAKIELNVGPDLSDATLLGHHISDVLLKRHLRSDR